MNIGIATKSIRIDVYKRQLQSEADLAYQENELRNTRLSMEQEQDVYKRQNEMRPLKVDPPGTAVWGRLFLKMMSRMVSPMPITFLMLFICLRFYTVRGFSNPGNRRDAVWHSRDSRS